MSTQTLTATPPEADWNNAPGLIEGATRLNLTAHDCHLDYWLRAAPQGTLAGLVNGHSPQARIPDYMLEPGDPLRAAIMSEFAFRSIAEEKATRAITYMIASAPDVDTMEFFGTQLIDEARHSRVFRAHLLELGVPEDQLYATIEEISGEDARRILVPLEEFSLPLIRDQQDFIAGVVILTILVEGVLAPAAELSHRKWLKLDPAAAEIERGANIDEIRHLTVGSAVVREHLEKYPEDRERVRDVITRGRQLWARLPTTDVIFKRELYFQQGLELHADVVGDYEIWPGRRLIDTTPEERLVAANTWSAEMQNSRLEYMGLSEESL